MRIISGGNGGERSCEICLTLVAATSCGFISILTGRLHAVQGDLRTQNCEL